MIAGLLPDGIGLWWIAIGLAAAAAILLTGWLLRRARTDDRRRLFLELCQAHALGWSDRRMLKWLARQRGLSDPARLFVEPHEFGLPSPPALDAHARRLKTLRERLFEAKP